MGVPDHEIDEPDEDDGCCSIHGCYRDKGFGCIGCACDEADRCLDSRRSERNEDL